MLAEMPMGTVIISCLFAVLCIVILFAVATYLRRRIHEADEPSPAGFSLSDLRELHQAGQLSDEEFERARGKMVAAAQAALARDEERKREEQKRREEGRGAM